MGESKISIALARAARTVNWHALGVAAFRVNLGVAMAWSLLHFVDFHTFFDGHDFKTFYTDAMLAWTKGWGDYYGGGDYNVNPPLQGLIMFPFFPFSLQVGFVLWTALGLGCMALVWHLAGTGKWWQFPIIVLLFPVLWGLALGQPTLLIAAIITVAWWLSERNHAWAAGLVLSLATLKPQLILLLPLVLLIAGRKREFVGFVLGALAIGLVSVGLVGVGGIEQMLAAQNTALGSSQSKLVLPMMVLRFWFPGVLGLGLTAGAALLTLGIAYRIRGAKAAPIYVVGILGSLLVTPYLHPPDLVLWIVAALLMLRSVGLPKGLAAVGVFCSWLSLFGVPLVSLGGLLVVLWRRRQVSPDVLAKALEASSPVRREGWLRESDSNARPPGYEPGEMPLLHPAQEI